MSRRWSGWSGSIGLRSSATCGAVEGQAALRLTREGDAVAAKAEFGARRHIQFARSGRAAVHGERLRADRFDQQPLAIDRADAGLAGIERLRGFVELAV